MKQIWTTDGDFNTKVKDSFIVIGGTLTEQTKIIKNTNERIDKAEGDIKTNTRFRWLLFGGIVFLGVVLGMISFEISPYGNKDKPAKKEDSAPVTTNQR